MRGDLPEDGEKVPASGEHLDGPSGDPSWAERVPASEDVEERCASSCLRLDLWPV